MPALRPTVFIIDDDSSVRRALERVMTAAGLDSRTFASVDDFFAKAPPGAHGCIVADMTMQGTGSLHLNQLLKSAGSSLPVIFVTALDTEEARDAAREAGAKGFFRKPVDMQALVDAIQWACDDATPSTAA